jgi:hypothetical protein
MLQSYWTFSGHIPAGATPPTGAGEVPTNATTGAIPFTNPTGGKKSYLTHLRGYPGSLYLYDRLVHTSGLACNVTTAQTVNSVSVNRPDATGAGTDLFLEFYVASGASLSTATVSYTNQSGTSGRTTLSVNVGSSYSNYLEALVWCPLAAGDTGVRSVQSVTLAGSLGAASNMGIVIARKIAYLPFIWSGVQRGPFDLGLPVISDNACMWIIGAGGGAAYEATLTVAQG